MPSLPQVVALAAMLIGVTTGFAHHDTEAMIADFTDRIESGENTAELYFKRAIEYRVLRRPEAAEADFRMALARDEDFSPAHRALAILLSSKGENNAAVKAAELGVERADSATERCAGLILLARMHSNTGATETALVHCQRAFELKPAGEVEWFLLHAELLGELEQYDQRADILANGHAATGSIVLRNAHIDALLDGSRAVEMLPLIETELAGSRLKSSWLLRRARVRMKTGDRSAAAEDLQACLKELSGRIHPQRPDLTLVSDRGLAQALLGNMDAAKADLKRARDGGADRWVTAPLVKAIARSES